MVSVQVHGWQEFISLAYAALYRTVHGFGVIRQLIQRVALVHIIGGLMVIGYAQAYYFHLRKFR